MGEERSVGLVLFTHVELVDTRIAESYVAGVVEEDVFGFEVAVRAAS